MIYLVGVSGEQIQRLMADVGPLCETIAGVYQEGELLWLVEFDDATLVIVEFDEEVMKLNLSAEIGAPDAEDRLKAYETMLIYNFASSQTGGLRLGLDEPDGKAFLFYDLVASHLELSALQRALANFADRAALMANLIEAGLGRETTTADHSAVEEIPGALRI